MRNFIREPNPDDRTLWQSVKYKVEERLPEYIENGLVAALVFYGLVQALPNKTHDGATGTNNGSNVTRHYEPGRAVNNHDVSRVTDEVPSESVPNPDFNNPAINPHNSNGDFGGKSFTNTNTYNPATKLPQT